MENATNLSIENAKLHDLLDRYLASRKALKSSAAETSFHLDDDSLATFVEGSLSEREAGPVVSHLVDCGFCLHKTAELVRLDLEVAEAITTQPSFEAQPLRISAVLNDLFSKIFGTSDGAVFAHEDKSDVDEESGRKKTPDESDS